MNLSKIRLSMTLVPAAALCLSALALPASAQTTPCLLYTSRCV